MPRSPFIIAAAAVALLTASCNRKSAAPADTKTQKQPGSAVASKTLRKSDFTFVFDGNNGTEVDSANVGDLAEMIQAIYDGRATIAEARNYLFLPPAVSSRQHPCELTRTLKDFLIYTAVITSRKQVDFAVRRDPEFESRAIRTSAYESIEEHYRKLPGDPAAEDPVKDFPCVVVGMEQFTTSAGLVRQIPIVQPVAFVR